MNGRCIALVWALQGLCCSATWALDIRALRDFSDPARSEVTFREHLRTASGDLALSLQTQIARSLSLRSRLDEAHALLDQIESRLPEAGPEPRVRTCLNAAALWARRSKAPELGRSFSRP